MRVLKPLGLSGIKTPARMRVDRDDPSLPLPTLAASGFDATRAAPPVTLTAPDPVTEARAQARRDLAPLFSVMPEMSAARRPNEVTPDEFEKAVTLYSDIA